MLHLLSISAYKRLFLNPTPGANLTCITTSQNAFYFLRNSFGDNLDFGLFIDKGIHSEFFSPLLNGTFFLKEIRISILTNLFTYIYTIFYITIISVISYESLLSCVFVRPNVKTTEITSWWFELCCIQHDIFNHFTI